MSTITCQQTRREISDFLDGDRTALASPAGEHVQSCGDCRHFLEDARALDGRLSQPFPIPGDGEAAELPDGFHERVLAAARGAAGERRVVPFARWLVPAAGAAAAALVALAVWKSNPGQGAGTGELAGAGAPMVAPVAGGAPAGLPTGFESPVDVPAMTAVASLGMETAFAREAEAMAADLLKVRDFFTSRVTVVGRPGL